MLHRSLSLGIGVTQRTGWGGAGATVAAIVRAAGALASDRDVLALVINQASTCLPVSRATWRLADNQVSATTGIASLVC